MLTQYRICMQPDWPDRVRPEWGYHLYAALLRAAPEKIGAELHREGVTPVSQFVRPGSGGSVIWQVTLCGALQQEELGAVLEACDSWHLLRERLNLRVTDRRKEHLASVEELFDRSSAGRLHRLEVQTPAAFKSRGRYLSLPGERLILQNLMKKWNGSFPDYPIEDADGCGMDAMADGLRLRRFRLEDRAYFLKGYAIPGFVGTLEIENRLSGFHRQLADALMLFSGFAGIGVKTTLGMGGVMHRALPEQA